MNLLGWAVLKTIYFPKKKLCVIDCCRFKRLSCFCFLFRSHSKITGLLGKNQVISWLFPLIRMSQGVAINSWRGKEEYGLVPNSTGHLKHSLGGSCQTAFNLTGTNFFLIGYFLLGRILVSKWVRPNTD